MGMIQNLLTLIFGRHNSALRDTVEVFRENAEAASQRGHDMQLAALSQLAAEFTQPKRGVFDRFVDGLNRLPRPALALGTLGLLASAMVDPVWFAARMQGIALVPEPLWWLLGVIVTFYFGARHQAKGQAFQQDLAATLARTPAVLANLEALEATGSTDQTPAVIAHDPNPGLLRWQVSRSKLQDPA